MNKKEKNSKISKNHERKIPKNPKIMNKKYQKNRNHEQKIPKK